MSLMKVLRALKFTDIANTSGSKSNWANLAMGLGFGVMQKDQQEIFGMMD